MYRIYVLVDELEEKSFFNIKESAIDSLESDNYEELLRNLITDLNKKLIPAKSKLFLVDENEGVVL